MPEPTALSTTPKFKMTQMSTDIAKSAKVSNKMEVSNEKSNGAMNPSKCVTILQTHTRYAHFTGADYRVVLDFQSLQIRLFDLHKLIQVHQVKALKKLHEGIPDAGLMQGLCTVTNVALRLPFGLFGDTVEDFAQQFSAVQKQTEVIKHILPRRDPTKPSCARPSSARHRGCSVCIFFCLENKHLNNCSEFRAVRDVSVSSLNADDQTLLEQMMEQEDHVRNRLRKKNQKSP
ncbi:xenotropic and polytropic retrovirus receptor 1-like protein [Labeo rohita]|uniref:Xenotropic and polytropic retrovirus receptor 1-like protein n=1 Tax=Labeo rohita TaxID=84645 RepID=A0A498L2X4_LABRO|nr:xenotropic and polytropic retrovirus receptor 1-like protein [Labeo rohita]